MGKPLKFLLAAIIPLAFLVLGYLLSKPDYVGGSLMIFFSSIIYLIYFFILGLAWWYLTKNWRYIIPPIVLILIGILWFLTG